VPGIGGHVFHVATAQETTIAHLATLLTRVLAQHGFTGTELRNAPPRTGDVQRNFADASKAAALLGWQAEVPLEEGLGRVVRWFSQHAGRREEDASGSWSAKQRHAH
jgi:UDP-glucose 4-epimerase